MLSPVTILNLIDSMAFIVAQAFQLARVRLALVASPVMRLLIQRDNIASQLALLRRKVAILRSQRELMLPHRRPDYDAGQRLAILQLKRLHGWSIDKTARRFVVHPHTIRSWINAIEGRGNLSLLKDAVKWNRIDDVVRWAAQLLRSLSPEPEFGTRTIARHLVRAGIAVSRSTVQRMLRQKSPIKPTTRRPPMSSAAGAPPHDPLLPTHPNHVWHLDLISLRVLWFRFVAGAILDGFSRKILAFHVFKKVPNQLDALRLTKRTIRAFGKPENLITDHGTQFRKIFQREILKLSIKHVRGKVRSPYLNGKLERAFRTFRIWWRIALCGITRSTLQKQIDRYQHWYNHHRPHSAVKGLTPDEAWNGTALPIPVPIRCRDKAKPRIEIYRERCRGDPHLPIIQITICKAA